jgi:LysM repeat protein
MIVPARNFSSVKSEPSDKPDKALTTCMARGLKWINQEFSVKKALLGLALISIGVAGCKQNSMSSGSLPLNDSVVDLAPVTTSTPAYQPPAPSAIAAPMAQPMSYDTNSSGANGSYVVRKGDTLYGIARQSYGDGKQWTRIASANPGVRPETLKVGQKIVIP